MTVEKMVVATVVRKVERRVVLRVEMMDVK